MDQGAFLRAVRLARGLSQTELARRCGILQPTLSAMEHGREPIGVKRATVLATILRIKPHELIWGKTPRGMSPVRSSQSPPVHLHAVAEHDWGWFSREDPRMHVQTMDSGHRVGRGKVHVWLEDRGTRAFIPRLGEKVMSGPQWKELRQKIAAHRNELESKWVVFMMANGWLAAKLHGSVVTLTAYPGTHNTYRREINLRRMFPRRYPEWREHPPKIDLDERSGTLRVGNEFNPNNRQNVELEPILFVGQS